VTSTASHATSTSATTGTDEGTDLLQAARAGRGEAFAELYLMHHQAALNFARTLTSRTRANDLVSDAFAKIFALMKNGKGPETAFKAYLMSTIRTLNIDSLRRTGREFVVDDFTALPEQPVVDDGTDERAEYDAVRRAFTSLPERWQTVLWASTVENLPLQQIADELEMTCGAVGVLAFRAREGLRQAYLAQHNETLANGDECLAYADDLPKYVRGMLRARRQAKVENHVTTCRECASAVVGLTYINERLGAVVLPLLLVGFTAPTAVGVVSGLPGAAAGPGLSGGVFGTAGRSVSRLVRRVVGHLKSAPAAAVPVLATAVVGAAMMVGLVVDEVLDRKVSAGQQPTDGSVRAATTPSATGDIQPVVDHPTPHVAASTGITRTTSASNTSASITAGPTVVATSPAVRHAGGSTKTSSGATQGHAATHPSTAANSATHPQTPLVPVVPIPIPPPTINLPVVRVPVTRLPTLDVPVRDGVACDGLIPCVVRHGLGKTLPVDPPAATGVGSAADLPAVTVGRTGVGRSEVDQGH
jgi:RNA polymerase sigma factor (sigma-70 family)